MDARIIMTKENTKTANLLHCVDVGLVSCKCLNTTARSNIPDLGGGIAGTRDKESLVRGYGQTRES